MKTKAVSGSKSSDGAVIFKVQGIGQYAVSLNARAFADLDSVPWAMDAIEQLAAKGIIKGVFATAFNPLAPIKRADFVKFLVDTLGLNAPEAASFSDVEQSAYYAEALETAKALGIATGVGTDRFLPDAIISREDAAVFIVRALKLKQVELTGGEIKLSNFKDESQISDYARISMNTLVEAGLLKGSGNNLNPEGMLTRAETAVLLYRILNLL
ncbi:S-layer homology domain-containing protein [Paenibacillus sp. FSL R10-2734]|uniref:S-layer homology domain-containing protein n=1 Tax=Paenibacillus sp. FSL R10-2734 TaxID=2954691 RepID=UPI0030D98335